MADEINLSLNNLTTPSVENLLSNLSFKDLASSLDLSQNLLATLPSPDIFSQFTSLSHLDISRNPFKENLFKICQTLQLLPNLTSLNISIDLQNDSTGLKIITSSLPKLELINGNEINKIPTEKDDSFEFYIPIISEYTQKCVSFFKTNLPLLEKFKEELKTQIAFTKNMLNFRASQEEITYQITMHNCLYDLMSFMYLFLVDNIGLKSKLKPNEDQDLKTLLNSLKARMIYHKNLLVNMAFTFIQLTQKNIFSNLENEMKEKNDYIELLTEERDKETINANKIGQENKNYRKENQLLYENVQKIKEENNLILNKVMNKAENIFLETFGRRSKGKSSDERHRSTEPSARSSTRLKDKNSFTKIKISKSSATKILALPTLLETIREIYKSKKIQNEKNLSSNVPLETLEQHLYTYLNHKYGLKKIIVEKAFMIISSIRQYSQINAEVCLFGKMIRNEIDESSIDIVGHLKSSLQELIKNITKSVRVVQDNEVIDFKVISIIGQALFKSKSDLEMFFTKIEETKTKRLSINFEELYNVILEIHIFSRSNYLKRFKSIFRSFDSENKGIANGNTIKRILNEIYTLIGVNSASKDEFIAFYAQKADPYSHDQATFSELVEALSVVPPFELREYRCNVLDLLV